jgi:hypothetical protein
MPVTEVAIEGRMGPDAQARTILAMQRAIQILEQARQRVEEGTIDRTIGRQIGEAMLLADQIGRSSR